MYKKRKHMPAQTFNNLPGATPVLRMQVHIAAIQDHAHNFKAYICSA